MLLLLRKECFIYINQLIKKKITDSNTKCYASPKCSFLGFLFVFVCLFVFTSLLGYKCFTVLSQFLLYNKVNQLFVYIYPHIPSLLSLPHTLPIPPLQVDTKHQADLPVLCSCFPLAIYFIFGSVYMSMLLSHFIPASHPSTSASLLLPCHQVHRYHFSRFHIYLNAVLNVVRYHIYSGLIFTSLTHLTLPWILKLHKKIH